MSKQNWFHFFHKDHEFGALGLFFPVVFNEIGVRDPFRKTQLTEHRDQLSAVKRTVVNHVRKYGAYFLGIGFAARGSKRNTSFKKNFRPA